MSASAAEAAQRYAAPGGSGTACTQATPCSLQTAVESSPGTDEVIVAPGTYAEGADPLQIYDFNEDVHGPAAGPKPVITSTASTAGVDMQGTGARLSDVRIEYSGGYAALFVLNGGTASRVEAISTTTGCDVSGGSLIRDSLCYTTGYAGAGMNPSGSSTAALRNVTAIGGTAGVFAGATGGSTLTMDMRNVIAIGGTADLLAMAYAPGTDISFQAEYSNFSSVTPPATGTFNPPAASNNQSAEPQFVNAAGGDFTELRTSPTVDAGSADPLTGATDLNGAARVQGPAMDIGAYELTPDTTAPDTRIDSGPRRRTRARRANFTFSSTETESTFRCKLDRGAFSPCTSPMRTRRLSRGRHSLTVVAVDASGNADATPAAARWRIKRRHHGHGGR